MKRTSQQHEAIYTHDRNVMVVAGAGSGKTYVLVERYLALLDANRDWPLNALVAITFTRKAAQEMRDRVRLELEKRRHSEPDGDTCWAERLATMDSARIDTIHGLCAAILRANAAEAGIDPQFNVLDETQADLLLDDVIDQVLPAATDTDSMTSLFIEYDPNAIRRTLRDLIATELDPQPKNWLDNWQTHWENNRIAVIQKLLQSSAFQNCIDWIPEEGWPTGEDRIVSIWQDCQLTWERLQQQTDIERQLDCLQAIADTIVLKGGSPKVWGGKDRFDEAKEKLKQLRSQIAASLQAIGLPPGYLDQRAADLLPQWIILIRQAQIAYAEAKQKAGVLDFDDLEKLTRHLLQNYHHIHRRYTGTEFKHILVDEFQDTNADQWDIVRLLADIEQPGRLFVVGDPKQSIYQFRGADVSVFDSVRAKILAAGGTAVALSHSFRSHQSLIACFNQLFQRILIKNPASPVADFEVELGDRMEAQRSKAPCDQAVLELLLVDKSQLGEDEENKTNLCRRWEAYEIAVRLRDIVEVEQRPVWDKRANAQRPIDFGDIAVLFQSMSHVTLYEDAFKTAGLPYLTIAGRGYYSRQEVWDLLNLLTVLHNPTDNLALATTLRSPLFGLSDDALLALRLCHDETGKRLSLWEALHIQTVINLPEDEFTPVIFARDCLDELHLLAGRVTVSELLREALARTGYLALLTALPNGAQRRGNIEKLLEKAQTSGQVTLGAFERYLRDLSEREVREGEASVEAKGAVTLMTVHASKGLEFPLVVLADSSWDRHGINAGPVVFDHHYGLACKVFDPDQNKLETSYAFSEIVNRQKLRETAERKRLLYVAATRAQDYLLVSGQVTQGKEGWRTEGWLKWLWEGLELDARGFQPTPGTVELDYPWGGTVRISVPTDQPDPEQTEVRPRESTWDNPLVRQGKPLSHTVIQPPLLAALAVKHDATAYHLTATQLADLGSADYDPFYRQRFRRRILHDAPDHIEDVNRQVQDISERTLGEIVHKVLGWWRFSSQQGDLETVLQSYAWEQGIFDTNQQAHVIALARDLLEHTWRSEVYAWISNASPIYRELPFIYRTKKRIIHGVIDVLCRRADGRWAIVDYKTSLVNRRLTLAEHARRYHLQVGIYAAAVREQLGESIVPDVYIHYIRHNQTVQVHTGEWEIALGKLEDKIGNLLNESDWID